MVENEITINGITYIKKDGVAEEFQKLMDKKNVQKLLKLGFGFSNDIPPLKELTGIKSIDGLQMIDKTITCVYVEKLEIKPEDVHVRIALEYLDKAIKLGMNELVITTNKDYPVMAINTETKEGMAIAPRIVSE